MSALGMLAATGSWAGELPRLAGTVIAPGHRAALFDTGSGVMIPAGEGESVGGYVVRSIGRGGVRLERDGQTTMLRPSAAGAPPAPVDTGGATFGLVLRAQPRPDD